MNPDIAYANADFIEGAEKFPPRWTKAAATFRANLVASGQTLLNQPYGPGDRQVFDLFLPNTTAQGVVVFVHGGYWRAFGKDDWSHFAAGPLARGFAVVMPSYTLAPEARISEITSEIQQAIDMAAQTNLGPIVLTGHSAGGHLVARMNCTDVPLSEDTANRLARIVPISPVSDLRPLLQTTMNDDFQLDMAESSAESPILHADRRGIETHVWVGADERPVFLEQARWLAKSWDEARLHIAPDQHHFDVIDGLAEPNSPLTKALLDGI